MAKTDLTNQRQSFPNPMSSERRWLASKGFKSSKSTFLHYYAKILSLKLLGTES